MSEMIKLHISVTEEDIKNGKPKDDCKCPIALALDRALTQAGYINSDFHVEGSGREMYIEEDDGKFYANTDNPQIDDFIKMFDERDNFILLTEDEMHYRKSVIQPFEFDVTFEFEEKESDDYYWDND